MDINFDEDTFGEMVQPSEDCSPKKSSKNTAGKVNLEFKQKKPYSNQTQHVSLFFKACLNAPKRTSNKTPESNWKTRSRADTKESNMENSGSSLQTSSRKKEELNIRNTLENQKFPSNPQTFPLSMLQNIQVTSDNKIPGDSNLIKFFQLKQSYSNGKSSINRNRISIYSSSGLKQRHTEKVSNISMKATVARNSTMQNIALSIQDNKNKHIGYQCDNCSVYPIEGKRYHCTHQQCNNDFDLCEECYERNGHRHEQSITKHQTTSRMSMINTAVQFLTQSTNLSSQRKSQTSKPIKDKSIFKSAIH